MRLKQNFWMCWTKKERFKSCGVEGGSGIHFNKRKQQKRNKNNYGSDYRTKKKKHIIEKFRCDGSSIPSNVSSHWLIIIENSIFVKWPLAVFEDTYKKVSESFIRQSSSSSSLFIIIIIIYISSKSFGS